MKKVYSADNPLLAQLVLGLLQQNGIPAVIQGDALWSARGELPFTPDSAPSVWVTQDEDADRALTLIQANLAPANPLNCANCGYNLYGLITPRCPECGTPFRMLQSWACPACGRTIEGQFTECWKCGTSRPEV
jgi:hypothetical protein